MTDYSSYGIPSAEIPGHALVQDLIPLYLEGDVTPETHAVISDHLKRCERCSGFLAGAQSARAQMLKEQAALRAVRTSGPSVAQVQQPAADAAGRALWSALMALSWLFGMGAIFLGVVARALPGIVIGPVLLMSGLLGLQAAGRAGGLIWKGLAVLTGLEGIFFLLLMTNPYEFSRFGILGVLGGVALLGVAAYGLWTPRGQPQPGSQPAVGPGLAISSAVRGLLGAAGLALMALFGLVLIAVSPYALAPRLLGVLLAMAGGVGLLELNQRYGWVAEWAAPRTKRRLQGLVAGAGGALWMLLVLQGWGFGSFAFLLALGIGGGLVAAGVWWYRRNK